MIMRDISKALRSFNSTILQIFEHRPRYRYNGIQQVLVHFNILPVPTLSISSSFVVRANDTLLFLSGRSELLLFSSAPLPIMLDSPPFVEGELKNVDGNLPPSKLNPASTY